MQRPLNNTLKRMIFQGSTRFLKKSDTKMTDLRNYTETCLERIIECAPLVHNITNYVVMNSSANILLALGASPVMAHSLDEVEDMAAFAGALVLNIGTLEKDWVDAMIRAGRVANDRNIPVILDPVGSGATPYRTHSVQQIMGECRISVLRGNASEVLSLADSRVTTKGVDSSTTIDEAALTAYTGLAEKHRCVVAVSGPEDWVTDGNRLFRIGNGHPLMTKVTGLGCGLSAVVGAFCAVSPEDCAAASAAAFGFYGLCGERAYGISQMPGSFNVAFTDSLYDLANRRGLEAVDVTVRNLAES
jgi:hydroxyethylthiazole kinase